MSNCESENWIWNMALDIVSSYCFQKGKGKESVLNISLNRKKSHKHSFPDYHS